MKNLSVILFAITLLIAVSCKENEIDDPKVIDVNEKSELLILETNEFGLDMFRLINNYETDNFTISPLSVALALAMTYNGAEGETKIAMEKAMRLWGLTTEEINASYQSLTKALLEADPKVTLEIAQSIWYKQNYNVLKGFKSVNETYYDAEVKELDFSRPDAKDVINKWIEDKTHNKIKDMIKEVNPLHVMFLVNAVYFNGVWQSEFKKSDTFKSDFYKEDGTKLEVDMMKKKDTVNYFYNDQFKDLFTAVELPYGRGNFNMVILLPGENKTCNDVIEKMTPDNWHIWMDSFRNKDEVSVWLPKFKDEYKIKLNDVLTEMGMGIAFNGKADFSGINGEGGIYIDYVQHNTFIDVNEKGTEAAAATVVAIKEMAALPENEFHVNKPFIFAITEKETNAILFIGKMKEPKY
ncbi:MAG: serpin family protein [Prolixibacteraceae bacterium]|nr:serpin family protein [Prolixibacteraceae bacterium]